MLHGFSLTVCATAFTCYALVLSVFLQEHHWPQSCADDGFGKKLDKSHGNTADVREGGWAKSEYEFMVTFLINKFQMTVNHNGGIKPANWMATYQEMIGAGKVNLVANGRTIDVFMKRLKRFFPTRAKDVLQTLTTTWV